MMMRGATLMKSMTRLHSTRFKLTLTFLLILLPLVSVSVFANNYSQQIMNEQISDRTRGALLTTLEYIDQLNKNMDQQTLLIASNPNIVDIWNDIDDPLHPDHLYGIHSVQQQLSALTNVNGAVKEAYIIHGESGNGVSTLKGGIKWPNIKRELWFQRTLDASGGLVVYVPTGKNGSEAGYLSDDLIYFIRLLDVFSSSQEPNVMILAVSKASFQKIIQHLQISDNMNITLFHNDGFVLETNPHSQYDSNNFSITVDSGFWSMQLEQPQSEVFQLSRQLQLFTYLIIFISILLAVWIAWLVHIQISKPLQQLSTAFKQFSSGYLSVQLTHKRKDEFGYVMNAFNRMAAVQRKMIEDDYEKELLLSKAEFNLLQSQINPHFLYNTLDSIYSVASRHKINSISEMVINLARFFRVSLGKGRDSFTLADTVQHLMYYIRVQQIRTDHFTVETELAAGTEELPLLKLILQPVVENAIVHGLAMSPDEGKLYIRSQLVDQRLHIEVEDTGAGIAEARLKEIQEELNKVTGRNYRFSPDSPAPLYFGLKNVRSRIKLYYGEEADLRLESEEGKGTRVTMILPIRKDEKL
jgi:two-component system sensor histidine kinase YesM